MGGCRTARGKDQSHTVRAGAVNASPPRVKTVSQHLHRQQRPRPEARGRPRAQDRFPTGLTGDQAPPHSSLSSHRCFLLWVPQRLCTGPGSPRGPPPPNAHGAQAPTGTRRSQAMGGVGGRKGPGNQHFAEQEEPPLFTFLPQHPALGSRSMRLPQPQEEDRQDRDRHSDTSRLRGRGPPCFWAQAGPACAGAFPRMRPISVGPEDTHSRPHHAQGPCAVRSTGHVEDIRASGARDAWASR